MSLKWKELLSDSSKYPDDFAVSMKDGQTLTLGEMRAHDAETKGSLTAELTRREQELKTRESNVNQASVNLATVIEKTAERAGLSVEDFLQGKSPSKRAVADANDLDESDPLVGKLVKEIKGLSSRLDSVSADNQKLRKEALGPMLNTYLEDYYEGKWEKLEPTLPKGSKVTRTEALAYAQENKLVDARGRFDLSKAARDLTYDARVNEEAEKRAEGMRKKIEDERVLAAAPKPSGTHINVKTDKTLLNQKGQTKNFDEVLTDALQDTEMWRSISQGRA